MQAMHLWGDGHRDPHELVTHCAAGGVMRAVAASHEARRPALTELTVHPLWRTGASLGMMARGSTLPHSE